MVVKINPRDVVSIPEDYDNAKGRCCRYEVVGVYNDDVQNTDGLSNKPVVRYEAGERVDDASLRQSLSQKAKSQPRDEHGRFVKQI